MQNVSSSQVGIDTSYGKQQQAGSAVPGPMGHPVVHPPIGGKVAYDEDEHEFYPSSRIERPMIYPHQPKLAAIPLPQRQPVCFTFFFSYIFFYFISEQSNTIYIFCDN